MTAATENIGELHVGASTLRVRQHRQRRRDGLRLFTVTVPETAIENAVARGLLAAEDRAKPWPVIQACYAALLSDAAFDWLAKGGLITDEQRGDAAAVGTSRSSMTATSTIAIT